MTQHLREPRIRIPASLIHRGLLGVLLVLGSGCPNRSAKQDSDKPPPQADAAPSDEPSERQEQEPAATADLDDPHRVVFADRTSQGYLLLVDDAHAQAPSREDLVRLVRSKLAGDLAEPEVEKLIELVQMEPRVDTRVGADMEGKPRQTDDLLGLHIDALPIRQDDGRLIADELLSDPISIRTLDPSQRASLAQRDHVILLRADYRNQYAVRGLRLLQTLVRLVADERDALIHDPDTGETMNLDAFTERRLQSSLGNIADQVAVVPFPDSSHGEQTVRLMTRGMRRFGSVDLELDGLPRDPAVLQAGTHLLYGLAYQMAKLGEFDTMGYAVEAPDTITVGHDDVAQAYGRRKRLLERCEQCPARTEVHLVERKAEAHDPRDHVVARVVAPRPRSTTKAYDHPAWVREALKELLGAS